MTDSTQIRGELAKAPKGCGSMFDEGDRRARIVFAPELRTVT
jgi:hypothetical protein